MKAPAAVSPFSAKSSKEQKEQWIWWQCQQPASAPVETKNLDRPSVPELDLPRQEEKPEPPPQRRSTRHSQYDAVVKRMQNAARKTKAFTSVRG